MDDMYTRTRLLLGDEGVDRLKGSSVLVCGCGAVGGYAIEALVRAGVGAVTLVDADTFSPSNLNRQILCTSDTIGRSKSECAAERARSINPSIDAVPLKCRITPETLPDIFSRRYDAVMDCIDTIACKAELIRYAYSTGHRVFSSMGAAMHYDPSKLRVSTLDRTSVCPMARNLRRSLRDIDESAVSVVYSEEKPPSIERRVDEHGKGVIGSLPTVPAVTGMMLASLAIDYLSGRTRRFRSRAGARAHPRV